MGVNFSLVKNFSEEEKREVLDLIYKTFDKFVGRNYSEEGKNTFYKFINL